jgi:hypothetical protein
MMETYPDHGCGRIGRRTGLFCGALGVLAAYFMLKITGYWESPMTVGQKPAMIFGVFVLFLASGYFGTKAGIFLCWRENKVGLDILIGLALAFGSNAISVLAGSVFYIFVHDPNTIIEVNRIPGIVFGNVILVSIVGGLPAAFLGVLYGLLVGLQLEKLDPIKYCDVHGV